MANTTITTFYTTIEAYIDFYQKNTPHLFAPQISINPLDIFIIRQLVDFLPVMPTVVDMDSHATYGVSQLIWVPAWNIKKLLILNTISDDVWEPILEQYLNELVQDKEITFEYITQLPASGDRYIVAIIVDVPQNFSHRIQEIFRHHPEAIVFILPLPAYGDEVALSLMQMLQNLESNYVTISMREQSPFFGTSQLGVVYNTSRDDIPRMVTRLKQLYTSNHDFLSLLKLQIDLQVQTLSEKMIQHDNRQNQQKQEQQLQAMSPPPQPIATGNMINRLFRQNANPDEVPTFRTTSQPAIKFVRDTYQRIFPLSVRLRFRNIRMRILGF